MKSRALALFTSLVLGSLISLTALTTAQALPKFLMFKPPGAPVAGGGGGGYSEAKAWRMDGTADLITVGYDASINVTTNLSIEIVFYCDAPGGANQHFFNRRVSGGLPYQFYINTSGHLVIYIRQASGTDKQYTYATDITGAWRHLVVTFDTGTLTVYLDGSDITGSMTKSPDDAMTQIESNTSDPVRIGNIESGSFYFDGDIARVTMWDTAILTSAEVTTLRDSGNFTVDPTSNSGSYTSSGDLVMALKMESDDGDSTDEVLDASGNGNHGTVTSMTVAANLVDR